MTWPRRSTVRCTEPALRTPEGVRRLAKDWRRYKLPGFEPALRTPEGVRRLAKDWRRYKPPGSEPALRTPEGICRLAKDWRRYKPPGSEPGPMLAPHLHAPGDNPDCRTGVMR